MIEITDNDMPITVAEKIINGTKSFDASPVAKAIHKALTGNDNPVMDMFSLNDIKEIADYLMIYVNTHKDDDYEDGIEENEEKNCIDCDNMYTDKNGYYCCKKINCCNNHNEWIPKQKSTYVSDTGRIVQEDENGCLNLVRETAKYQRVMGIKGVKDAKDETF